MVAPISLSKIPQSLFDLHQILTEISLFIRRKLLDSLDSKNLSLNKYRVLQILRQTPNLSLSSLEEIITIKKGNLSRIVDALVRQNLLNRQRDKSSDRRKIALSITQKGIQILGKEDQKQKELIRTLYQAIPRERIKEYALILSDLQRYLQGSSD